MIRSLLVFMLALFCSSSYAQSKISGRITDGKAPLEFGEVILILPTDVAVKSQLLNKKGEFSIEAPNGSYTIQIRQFNSILHTRKIEVTTHANLGDIVVDNAIQLKSITISKQKSIVERKADRLVFNIENTISAAGGDALDALRVTPGVRVQNDNITIAGKGAVMVLIEDKIVELRDEDLANFLKSIPADNIQSIEVITTPPAKYEAIGNSGLINIKLKKSKKDSWSMTVGTNYLRRKEHGEGGLIGNFLYNKSKLDLSVSINYRDGGTYYDQQDQIHFPDAMWNPTNPLRRKYKRLNGIVTSQYKVTNKWNVGLQYLGNYNNIQSSSDRKLLVHEYNTNNIIKDLNSPGTADQEPVLHSVNLFNEIKFGTKGKKVILNLDYFNYNNNDSRPYEGTSIDYNPYKLQYFKGSNRNRQTIDNYAAKIDFELPTKWANIGFGSKISFSKADNSISQFNSGIVGTPVEQMPETESTFKYAENVQAIYVSGTKKITKSFESQVGLRLETIQTKANSQGNTNQEVRNNYAKLFPSVNLSYSLNNNHILRLNYSKRIERPSFAQLNPNVSYVNPFQTLGGNPFLQPAFVDNFEFIYSYKKLDSKIYYTEEDNMFAQVILPESETKFIQLVYLNYLNMKRYGISEIFVFDRFKWWTSNNTVDFNYIVSKSFSPFAKGREGLNIKLSTNNDFVLNKDKTVLFNVNYTYNFPETYAIAKYKARSNLSFALQYLLLNKNLRITLKANDLLRTERWRSSATVNGVYQSSDYYFDARYFQLSLTYKFGKIDLKGQNRKTGNEEERIRTGN